MDNDIQIRPIDGTDVERCGHILFEAFKGIADRHNFPRDFASAEVAAQFIGSFVASPSIYGVVAELEGRVVGSNFLWEYDPVRAVGPITVDPETQARGVGRRLMQAVIERGRGAAGIRLVQDSFNARSLSLYASLGFDVREPLVMIEGRIEKDVPPGFEVRPLTDSDIDACAELCRRVHGFERAGELRERPPMFPSFVALRGGAVTAYASSPHFWPLNHAVAETEEDMRALLSGASRSGDQPLCFLLPIRQATLFRWLLGNGLRVVKPMNLMTMGDYVEPRSSYLTSVGY
jgi:predicted N-acetyltransferase YhbS